MSDDLSKSVFLKSCPRCSQKEGGLVFKPYPQSFGKRHRDPQSWCIKCRAETSNVRNVETLEVVTIP